MLKTWPKSYRRIHLVRVLPSRYIEAADSPSDVHTELRLDDITHDLPRRNRLYRASGEFSRTIILSTIYQRFNLQNYQKSPNYSRPYKKPNVSSKDVLDPNDTAFHADFGPSSTSFPLLPEISVQDAMDSLMEVKSSSADWSIHNAKLYHYIAIMILVPLHALFELSGYHSSRESHLEAQSAFRHWIRSHKDSADCIVQHATSLFTLLRKHGLDSHSDGHCLQISMFTLWSILKTQVQSPDPDDISSQLAYIYIPGIGRLRGTSGARCVLVEALRMFRSIPRWEISKQFAAIAEALLVKGDALDL